MAKKKSFFGTVLKLGGLAAATAAVYYKRDEIKAFLLNTAEKFFPDEAEAEPIEEIIEAEPEIVIDGKAAADAAEEAVATEEAEESAPEE